MPIEGAGGPVQMSLPWELTPEDLHIIHRTAQDAAAQRRDQQMDSDMQEVLAIFRQICKLFITGVFRVKEIYLSCGVKLFKCVAIHRQW